MKTVYKYPMGITLIPKGAIIRKAGIQNGEIFLWAEVDTDAPKVHRHIYAFGTGHLIPENACFIDTVFDGAFVWHVYEVV